MNMEILPDAYRALTDEELNIRITEVRERLGDQLCILGHYYQRDEVIAHADHEGDSFQLAKFGAQTKARFIVFCGVHFMAEAAAILAREDQRVFLPNLEAGCPLADMADVDHLDSAWEAFAETGIANDFLLVTYVNSSATIKAYCGRFGGTACTSSSAMRAFEWAKKQGKRVFFLPDENLGRNTALASGCDADLIRTWDPHAPDFFAQAVAMKDAQSVVWKGYCHVHTFFTPEHVREARKLHPGCRIAVHPECSPEVVALADANGSTSFLKEYAMDAPEGSTVIIGTEVNFVHRLAERISGKRILPLARSLCPNMFRTSLADLCWTLESLGEVNEITIPTHIKQQAGMALERMLQL